MTENHDYDLPQQGTTNWHVPLNRNFERLDSDVEVRDRIENVGDYVPKNGAKFLAVDTGEVLLGDGDDWRSIGSLDRESHFVPPEVGMAGIQSVIDDHGPYVTIQLGDGTYTGTGITLDHGIVIRGAGKHQTSLRLADGADANVIGLPNADERNAAEVVLRDFSLDGNKANNDAGNGIYAPFWDSRIENVSVRNCAEHGIWIAGSTAASTDDNVVSNNRVNFCDGVGIKCGTNETAYPAVGAQRIVNNFVGANGSGGILCRGNAYCVYANQIYENGWFQVKMDRSQYSAVIGNRIDPSVAPTASVVGVSVVAQTGVTAHSLSVVSNYFEGDTDIFLLADADGEDVSGLTVVANVFATLGNEVDRGIAYEGTGAYVRCELSNNTFTGAFTTAEVDVPDVVTVNGEAIEAADAAEPQERYPVGTLVRFTDTNDGSETGTYLYTRDGTFLKMSDEV